MENFSEAVLSIAASGIPADVLQSSPPPPAINMFTASDAAKIFLKQTNSGQNGEAFEKAS